LPRAGNKRRPSANGAATVTVVAQDDGGTANDGVDTSTTTFTITVTEPPAARAPKQPLLTFPLIMRAGLVSLIMLGGGLGLFPWELRIEQAGLAVARTVAVNAIVWFTN